MTQTTTTTIKQLTVELLEQIDPRIKQAPDAWAVVDSLELAFKEFNINTLNQRAAFIAQCGHESAGFSKTKENLNYSSEALLKLFKKYFKDPADAAAFHRKPEAIANRIYANRMGNGPESSGEGYKFRGRGFIQLTGKENYTNCGNALGVDLIARPEYLETPDGAARSAGWFWTKNKLNELADADDIKAMTKRINGGYIGLEERTSHYAKAKEVLNG